MSNQRRFSLRFCRLLKVIFCSKSTFRNQCCKDFNDGELIEKIKSLAFRERQLTLEIVEFIAEVGQVTKLQKALRQVVKETGKRVDTSSSKISSG